MREKGRFTVLCGFLKNSDIYSNLDGEPAEQQSDILFFIVAQCSFVCVKIVYSTGLLCLDI